MCESPGPGETAPAGGPSTAPGAWRGLSTSRGGGMSPLLWGEGQGGGCPHSTQPLWGNRKPPYEATLCGGCSRPGASPSPHAWCSRRSTAHRTGAGTDASGEAWLHRSRGRQFPPHRPTAGAGIGLFRSAGAPGWAATAPGAGRPAHRHQLLGPSHAGVWGLCLPCRLSHASGLPHWCFPGNGGQHWGRAWGPRSRTPHIISFGV